jgi:hypothetical protein
MKRNIREECALIQVTTNLKHIALRIPCSAPKAEWIVVARINLRFTLIERFIGSTEYV